MTNMQKQVFSYVSMMWMDVVSENETAYGIVDFDGVNTIVIKDGTEKVRMIDNG